VSGKLNLALNPLVRAHFAGEKMDARPSIPDTFTLAAVPPGDYSFFPPSAPEGLYIKEITYAGVSVLHGTVRVGSAMGNAGLRVIVASGAAKIDVNVTDQQSKAVVGVNIVALPAGASDEATVAASLATSSTDQDGNCTLAHMRPGKYYVLAVNEPIDMTPELIGKLVQARTTQGSEVDLAAGGAGQATIKVASLQ
jgi:hypothetical protein